jgi:hypothetical protein
LTSLRALRETVPIHRNRLALGELDQSTLLRITSRTDDIAHPEHWGTDTTGVTSSSSG